MIQAKGLSRNNMMKRKYFILDVALLQQKHPKIRLHPCGLAF